MNFSEICIKIQFSYKRMLLKMSSAKWRLFCLGFNLLRRDGVPHSSDPRIDIDKTSIRRFRVGSMTNRYRSEDCCYMGLVGVKLPLTCVHPDPDLERFLGKMWYDERETVTHEVQRHVGDLPCVQNAIWHRYSRYYHVCGSKEKLRIPLWRHQMDTLPRYCPFVRGIHRWPVDSPPK